MDQERFDRLTRTLATGQSRRGMLKGLFAAAGMTVLGRGTVDAAKGGGGSGGPSIPKQCAAYCSRQGGPGSGAADSLCQRDCLRNGGPPITCLYGSCTGFDETECGATIGVCQNGCCTLD